MPIDKHWEEKFDDDKFDDYKAAIVERERLRQENSNLGWIYIGLCTLTPGIAKIGLTTGALGTRASGSQNPFYALLCAFKVKDGTEPRVFSQIESDAIGMLEGCYKRINHVTSGKKSEWFYADPTEFRKLVHDFLYEKYSLYLYCYYCSERDTGVIYSWENNYLVHGRSASSYQANDLSNPPIAFECQVPPGCGAECQCW